MSDDEMKKYDDDYMKLPDDEPSLPGEQRAASRNPWLYRSPQWPEEGVRGLINVGLRFQEILKTKRAADPSFLHQALQKDGDGTSNRLNGLSLRIDFLEGRAVARHADQTGQNVGQPEKPVMDPNAAKIPQYVVNSMAQNDGESRRRRQAKAEVAIYKPPGMRGAPNSLGHRQDKEQKVREPSRNRSTHGRRLPSQKPRQEQKKARQSSRRRSPDGRRQPSQKPKWPMIEEDEDGNFVEVQ